MTDGVHAVWQKLQRQEPFASMQQEHLAYLIDNSTARHFDEGDILFTPDKGVVRQLSILLTGSVVAEDIYTHDPFATLGQGEMFPLGALLSKRAVTNFYRAQTPGSLAILAEQAFEYLLEQSEPFKNFCTHRLATLLSKAREHSVTSLPNQSLSLHTPLAALIRRPPVTCRPDTTLRQLLEQMSRENVGSVVVTTDDSRPLGVFTLRDLLAANLNQVADTTPARLIMRTPQTTLPSSALATEAILALASHGERHVLVCNGQTLIGIVSEHDLYRLSRLDLKELMGRLDHTDNTDTLSGIATAFRRHALQLFIQGMDADAVTRMLSLFNDRLVSRLCEIHLAPALSAGMEVCWMQLGSEARQEPTLITDQNNGLLFIPPEGEPVDPLRQHLLSATQRISTALSACGIPRCPANRMASHGSHCLSLEEWQNRLNTILSGQQQQDNPVGIYLDTRPLWGNIMKGLEFGTALQQQISRSKSLLGLLGKEALSHQAPLNWRGKIIADHDDLLDLKKTSTIFVDGARILALAGNQPLVRTAERLKNATSQPGLNISDCQAWADSFEFIQGLRLKHQLNCLENGRPINSLINPEKLNPLDNRILKETLRQARKLQQWLARNTL